MSKTWTMVHAVYDNIHAALWAALCVFVLYFIAVVAPGLPAARALFEHQRLQEISAESRNYCEKWGMPTGTFRHETCVHDLITIRANVEKRIVDDSFF
jgi:hypothetical protein